MVRYIPISVLESSSTPVFFTSQSNSYLLVFQKSQGQQTTFFGKFQVKMQWSTLAFVALLAQQGSAQNMLRFACSQLVVDRVDPIVNPGQAYTPHLHQIIGGNSFNITMDPVSHNLVSQSTCTSCSFKEDLSNYWTAVMFFKAKNGTYKRVPQVGNGGPQGKLINKGGMDIYYIPSGKTTAFKPVSML